MLRKILFSILIFVGTTLSFPIHNRFVFPEDRTTEGIFNCSESDFVQFLEYFCPFERSVVRILCRRKLLWREIVCRFLPNGIGKMKFYMCGKLLSNKKKNRAMESRLCLRINTLCDGLVSTIFFFLDHR